MLCSSTYRYHQKRSSGQKSLYSHNWNKNNIEENTQKRGNIYSLSNSMHCIKYNKENNQIYDILLEFQTQD